MLESLESRILLDGELPGSIDLGFTVTPGSNATTYQGAGGLTVGAVKHAYGIDAISFAGITGDGTGQTIAIVDGYDDPQIAADLQSFDAAGTGFGLPNPTLRVFAGNGSGVLPPADTSGNWEIETSLDVEWAHAVAPGAVIDLVEAVPTGANGTLQTDDLMTAARYAANLPGVTVVSMSFGTGYIVNGAFISGEPSQADEQKYDGYFTTPAGHQPVTFVASTGDTGAGYGPEYPAVSPSVVAVGGTVLSLNSNNTRNTETAWFGSGGGVSLLEGQPTYQIGYTSGQNGYIPGNFRTIPDVAMYAAQTTVVNGQTVSTSAVPVYDSYGTGGSPWLGVYGTSLSAPMFAGVTAIADQGRALFGQTSFDSNTLHTALYNLPAADFYDVTSGNNLNTATGLRFDASPGYDEVTGRGVPIATSFVHDLTSNPVANAGFEFDSVGSWTYGGSGSAFPSSTAHIGSYSAEITGGYLYQTVAGLQPSTTYVFSAWTQSTGTADLGVGNYGGISINVAKTNTGWVQQSITFTTGPSNTSAAVFLSDLSGTCYFDDVSLQALSSSDNLNFATGALNAWTTGTGTAITNASTTYASAPFSAQITSTFSASGYIYQTINGLSPNTTYLLSAYSEVASAGSIANLSVSGYGSSVLSQLSSATTWTQQTIIFTTGPSATSANISLGENAGGTGSAFFDSVSITDLSTIDNFGFESGSLGPPLWNSSGGATLTSATSHTGTYSVQVTGINYVEQTINALQPNTSYTFSAWMKTASGTADLGVGNYGGVNVPLNFTTTSPTWTQVSIHFTTGSTTAAQIYLDNITSFGSSYFDDVTVTQDASPQGYQFTPLSPNVTITQDATYQYVSDGIQSIQIPVAAPLPVTISSGFSSEAIILDQTGGAVNLSGGLGIQGSGQISLKISSGSYTFNSNAGASAPNLTIESSAGASLTFATAQTFSGLIVDSGTTVAVNSGLTVTTITDNGTLNFNSSGVLTISAPITGNGNLSQQGTGTLILTATNTYSGNTTINAGTLQVGNSGATGTLGSGTIFDSAHLAFSRSGSLSVGSNITGSGNLILNTGTVTLGGSNTYSGGTTVNGGLLIVANSIALGGGGLTIHSGAAVQLQAGLASAVKIPSITFDGTTNAWSGTLDVTNSKIIVEVTSGKSSMLTALVNQAIYGRTHSAGIISSTAASTMAVAVVDNALLGRGTFGGVSADPNSILLSEALLGDANVDGHVDLTDLSTVLNNFGASAPAWTSGNFDGAATIDLTDLSAVLNNFGLSFTGFSDIVATSDFVSFSNIVPTSASVGFSQDVGNDTDGFTIVVSDGTSLTFTASQHLTELVVNALATLNTKINISVNIDGPAALDGTLAFQSGSGNFTLGHSYTLLDASGGITGQFASISGLPALSSGLNWEIVYSATDVTAVVVGQDVTFTAGSNNLSVLHNAVIGGSDTLQVSDGTTTVLVPAAGLNSFTIDASGVTGNVLLTGDADVSGVTLANGTFEVTNGHSATANGAFSLNGASLVIDSGATFNWNSGDLNEGDWTSVIVNNGIFNLASTGSLNLAGGLTNNGVVNWWISATDNLGSIGGTVVFRANASIDGTTTGPGTYEVASGITLSLKDDVWTGGVVLTVDAGGSLDWQGAVVYVDPDVTINNYGTITYESGSDAEVDPGCSFTVNNYGTINGTLQVDYN